MSSPLVVITGGEGDLAGSLAAEFENHRCTVLRPGRRELDVRSQVSVTNFFDKVGPISVLVNNAAITGDDLFSRLRPERWGDVIDTNLKGVHLCSQAAARQMTKQRDGHIINLGSYSAVNPPIGQTAYAAAKAGLVGLTKSYAKEFGSRNIRVNCVLPGFLETRMTAGLDETKRTAALERHSLQRLNTAEEAAHFVRFLTTTSFISGQVFQLDSRV